MLHDQDIETRDALCAAIQEALRLAEKIDATLVAALLEEAREAAGCGTYPVDDAPIVSSAEYERLAAVELEAALVAPDDGVRKTHLDQAAVYAHLAEQVDSRKADPGGD